MPWTNGTIIVANQIIVQDPATGDTVFEVDPTGTLTSGPAPGGIGQIQIVPTSPPEMTLSTGAAYESARAQIQASQAFSLTAVILSLISGAVSAPNTGVSRIALNSASTGGADSSIIMNAQNALNTVNSQMTLTSAGLNVDKQITLSGGAWTNLGFLAGWSQLAAASSFAAKVDALDFVHLRGAAAVGTVVDGTVIATLAAAYRPPKDVVQSAAKLGAVGFARLFIRAATGNIEVFDVGAATALYFDQVIFGAVGQV